MNEGVCFVMGTIVGGVFGFLIASVVKTTKDADKEIDNMVEFPKGDKGDKDDKRL